jgi:hypothetical protein
MYVSGLIKSSSSADVFFEILSNDHPRHDHLFLLSRKHHGDDSDNMHPIAPLMLLE